MNNTSMYGHVSNLFTHGRDLFDLYKQMTPTRDGSNFDTMQYAWKNRDHTYKAFGVFDTGRKDYGMQMLRNPWQAYNFFICLHRINQTSEQLKSRYEREH